MTPKPDTTVFAQANPPLNIKVRVRHTKGVNVYYLETKKTWGLVWEPVVEYWDYHKTQDELVAFNDSDTAITWAKRILNNPALIRQIGQGTVKNPDEKAPLPPPTDRKQTARQVGYFLFILATIFLCRLGPRPNDDEELTPYFLKQVFVAYPPARWLFMLVLASALFWIITRATMTQKK